MAEKKKFNFWFPLDSITKGKDKEGNEVMKIKGIASTPDKDYDGESLDPSGFNLQPLLKSGFLNWHHQTKNTSAAIIGEPTKAKIIKYKGKNAMYLEGELYPSSPLAQDVYNTMQVLKKDSKTRCLGFSIEGNATERDPDDEEKVLKADITDVAITHKPKNASTMAEILKAMDTGG